MADERTRREREAEKPPPAPGWVKLFGLAAAALLLLAGLHLSGNSPMGPGSHTPPASVTDHRPAQP